MIEDIIKKVIGGLDGVVDDFIKLVKGKVKEKIFEVFVISKFEYFKNNVGRIG